LSLNTINTYMKEKYRKTVMQKVNPIQPPPFITRAQAPKTL